MAAPKAKRTKPKTSESFFIIYPVCLLKIQCLKYDEPLTKSGQFFDRHLFRDMTQNGILTLKNEKKQAFGMFLQ
jgi:hypothetical protein